MYIFGVFYVTSCNFMSTDFLMTLIMRQVTCWAFILFNIQMWRRHHDFNIVANLLVNIVLIMLMEGGNFCNMRSKAILFLRAKKIGMQEQQLSNLLDAVPDKVLICSRA